MHFSTLFLIGAASMVAATASPDPTPGPDVANAMAALLRERQVQEVKGQLPPGLSGSVGPDRSCGDVGAIPGCFGAAGSFPVTLTPVNANASTTSTKLAARPTGTKTGTATGAKATSSSGASAIRDYGSASVGSILLVVGGAVAGFAVMMT
ncbi:hypothetical protein FKW77_005254 [Venturia effusa]|uniref:Hydrophobin n=1 Tax=Venturia effusa TaxID=50376 RepID=A0A517LDP8_9PEZI|nr:hypothetical protein FKW77_005254 [Venturia effusa]